MDLGGEQLLPIMAEEVSAILKSRAISNDLFLPIFIDFLIEFNSCQILHGPAASTTF